ncbi:MAG: LamG-like jellyroll fold domain-containing protein [Phototrophicaceae bacterium]
MADHTFILHHERLLTFWDFDDNLQSQGQYQYNLQPMVETLDFVEDSHFGSKSLYLKRGDWLRIPRGDCSALNIHGKNAQITVVAWLKRMQQPPTYDCETIAGVWDESRKKRQYCLFLDLPIWESGDQVGGHVSYHGGPTPNYKYCMDAAIGATPVKFDEWHCVGFTYDGEYARSYLDGVLDVREGRNPFHYPQGLFDGGTDGADFTVGAVSRSGEAGNFFHGILAGLAIYDTALSDDAMRHLATELD